MNWVWAAELTIFHALISIVIPNVLANVVFPDARGRRITGRVGLPIFCLVLGADIVLGGLALSNYSPPLVPFLLAIVAVGGFVVLARFLPAFKPPVVQDPSRTAALPYFVLGLSATLQFFVLSWVVPGLPNEPVPPLVNALLMVELIAALLFGLREIARRYPLNDLHQWALVSGALAFFIVLSPLIQMDPKRTNAQGMVIVGIGMAVFLALVRILIQRRRKPA